MSAQALAELLRRNGIADERVLAAIATVPRDLFVPDDFKDLAWQDQPLPIGSGQTISQPYVVAYMTEQLGIRPGDRVLEIGTGCGYQTAVLVACGAEVWSVEVIPALAETAEVRLADLGYGKAVHQRTGQGRAGWPEAAPFDAIICTAAAEEVPEAWLEQLCPHQAGRRGGRLILPVARQWAPGVQDLLLVERTQSGWDEHVLTGVRFVPLV